MLIFRLKARILLKILEGKKIEAIKVVCETTGVGLTEAKQMVDRLEADLAAEHPDLVIPKKPGCAVGSSLIAISAISALAFLAVKVIG